MYKGQAVGKLVPQDGIHMRIEQVKRRTGPNGSGRYPDGFSVNRKQGHICKYVSDVRVKAIF